MDEKENTFHTNNYLLNIRYSPAPPPSSTSLSVLLSSRGCLSVTKGILNRGEGRKRIWHGHLCARAITSTGWSMKASAISLYFCNTTHVGTILLDRYSCSHSPPPSEGRGRPPVATASSLSTSEKERRGWERKREREPTVADLQSLTNRPFGHANYCVSALVCVCFPSAPHIQTPTRCVIKVLKVKVYLRALYYFRYSRKVQSSVEVILAFFYVHLWISLTCKQAAARQKGR